MAMNPYFVGVHGNPTQYKHFKFFPFFSFRGNKNKSENGNKSENNF